MHKQLNFISILGNVIYLIVVGSVLVVCLAKVGGHLRITFQEPSMITPGKIEYVLEKRKAYYRCFSMA